MVAWETHGNTSNREDVYAIDYDDPFDNDYAESSAESVASDGIDPLLGTRILTSVGPGVVDEIREYEDMHYCIVRLDTFGTVNIHSKTAEALLRKERKLSPQKGLRSSGNSRFQNVKGYIRMYNPAKGWGFIVCEEFEGDIFLHSKHMITHAPREYIGHFHSNQEGHQVKFDLDLQHRSRPQALNVRLLAAEVEPPKKAVYIPPRAPFSAGKALDRPQLACNTNELSPEDMTTVAEGSAPAGTTVSALESGAGRSADGDIDPPPSIPQPLDDAEPGAAAQCRVDEGAGDPSSAAAATATTAEDESTGGGNTLWMGTGPVPARVAQKRGILRMRGLPFTATTSDVAQFFDGFGVRPEDVTLSTRADGLTNGEAHVQFAREDIAARALRERNMSNMGHRYIELFPTKVGTEASPGTTPSAVAATANWQPGCTHHVAGQEFLPGAAPLAPAGIAAAAGPSPAPALLPGAPPTPYVAGIVDPGSQGVPGMQAVIAGAAAPTPAAAAAATYAAQYAAAAHSAQGMQQAPTQGANADQGPQADYVQSQHNLVYQQYFQHFQQVYAAAAASQAVQAAAAAAAQQAAAQQFQPQHGQQQQPVPQLPPFDYTAASAAAAAATAIAPSDGASTAAVAGSPGVGEPSEGAAHWPTPVGAGPADAAAAGVQSQGGWHGTPAASPQEPDASQGVWQGAAETQPDAAGWWAGAGSRLPTQPLSAATMAPPATGGLLPGYSEVRPQYYNEI